MQTFGEARRSFACGAIINFCLSSFFFCIQFHRVVFVLLWLFTASFYVRVYHGPSRFNVVGYMTMTAIIFIMQMKISFSCANDLWGHFEDDYYNKSSMNTTTTNTTRMATNTTRVTSNTTASLPLLSRTETMMMDSMGFNNSTFVGYEDLYRNVRRRMDRVICVCGEMKKSDEGKNGKRTEFVRFFTCYRPFLSFQPLVCAPLVAFQNREEETKNKKKQKVSNV